MTISRQAGTRIVRFVRRPARFLDGDYEDSDSDHDRCIEAEADYKFDVELHTWYETEVLQSMALNGAVSSGANSSTLSKRFLPPGNTQLLFWEFLSQANAVGTPENATPKCPSAAHLAALCTRGRSWLGRSSVEAKP